MPRRLIAPVALATTVAALLTTSTAQAAYQRPKLLSTTLSDDSLIVDPDGGCTVPAVLKQRFSDPGHVLTKRLTSSWIENDEGKGIRDATRTVTRSGDITTITSTARLCGTDEPGGHVFFTSVWVDDETYLTKGEIFYMRYRPRVSLNASPEPVAAGGQVKLNAFVGEGTGEVSVETMVRFYFRPDGGEYTYRGKAKNTCRSMPDTDPYCVASRKFRQKRSGTWKAVSAGTYRVGSGSATDHVRVS